MYQKRNINEKLFSWFDAMADSVDGLVIIDSQNKIVKCSQSLARILQKNTLQLNGKLIGDCFKGLNLANSNFEKANFSWSHECEGVKQCEFKIIQSGFECEGNNFSTLTFKCQSGLASINSHLYHLQSEFESIFTKAVDAIVFINEKGIIQKVNPATSSLFGYEKEELIGKNVAILMSSPHSEKHDEYISNYLKSGVAKIIGKGRTVEGRLKNGRLFPMRLSVNEVVTESGKIFTGIIQDITQEKLAERKIKKLNTSLEGKVALRTSELSKTVSKLLSSNKKMELILIQKENITNALKQSELELKESLQKEKELGDLKSRFVTTASHEFRTPLSSILSSAEIVKLLLDKNEIERTTKHLDRIMKSTESLSSILDEFLSLSRLEEGMQHVRTLDCELNTLVKEIVHDFTPSLKEGQQIEIQTEESEIPLKTDEKILRQVILNLLSNASKYSPEKSNIICKFEKTNDSVTISVIDKGMGIPESDIPHLFARFFRAQNAINIQGTGLGLNIIKRFLTLLQGSIEVKSTLGEGSEFTIQLPIKLQLL